MRVSFLRIRIYGVRNILEIDTFLHDLLLAEMSLVSIYSKVPSTTLADMLWHVPQRSLRGVIETFPDPASLDH